MDWPKELLELFDDPLLDGVRSKVTAPTTDDRMSQKLAEVRAWMERHGRAPERTGDLKEKMMWAAMTALRNKNLMVELFDIPADMRKAMEDRRKADYIAQRKQCEDFDQYRSLFEQVHRELKAGRRSLVRISKTVNLKAGHYYIVDGQLLLLESISDQRTSSNFLPDGRTRCIFENGTESDILLQTLRKNVVGNGYAVTELQEESESKFFTNADVAEKDKVTGYIYVLRSLSTDPVISSQQHLYKIGFSTRAVEERIANAEHEPTYLMAPVEIVATYKIVNLHSHKFEDLVHQVLKAVQFHVTVIDDEGKSYEPREWFVVPLNIVDVIIGKIMDGTILGYTYNPDLKCLEQHSHT